MLKDGGQKPCRSPRSKLAPGVRGLLQLETALRWTLSPCGGGRPRGAPELPPAAAGPYPGAKMTSSGRWGPGPGPARGELAPGVGQAGAGGRPVRFLKKTKQNKPSKVRTHPLSVAFQLPWKYTPAAQAWIPTGHGPAP